MQRRYFLRRLAATMLAVLGLACVLITVGPAPATSSADGATQAPRVISGDDSEYSTQYGGPVDAATNAQQYASCTTTKTEISCELR